MSKTTFTLTEENSNQVIAVIQLKTDNWSVVNKPKKAKKLVAQAVKDEWCYEEVTCEAWDYNESNNQMTFDCTLDGGENEIRSIDLNITALYK